MRRERDIVVSTERPTTAPGTERTDDMDLEAMTMGELVELYNSMDPEREAGGKTFKGKAQAMERIRALAEERGRELDAEGDEGDECEEEEPERGDAPETDDLDARESDESEGIDDAVEEAPAALESEPRPRAKRVSIRARAEELLRVVSEQEQGQDVGLPYDDVLATIKAEYPECRTTVACLRWYGVQLREGGTRVPPRPSRGYRAQSTETPQP